LPVDPLVQTGGLDGSDVPLTSTAFLKLLQIHDAGEIAALGAGGEAFAVRTLSYPAFQGRRQCVVNTAPAALASHFLGRYGPSDLLGEVRGDLSAKGVVAFLEYPKIRATATDIPAWSDFRSAHRHVPSSPSSGIRRAADLDGSMLLHAHGGHNPNIVMGLPTATDTA